MRQNTTSLGWRSPCQPHSKRQRTTSMLRFHRELRAPDARERQLSTCTHIARRSHAMRRCLKARKTFKSDNKESITKRTYLGCWRSHPPLGILSIRWSIDSSKKCWAGYYCIAFVDDAGRVQAARSWACVVWFWRSSIFGFISASRRPDTAGKAPAGSLKPMH